MKRILFFIVLISVFACNNDEFVRPESIISDHETCEKEFVYFLLTDIDETDDFQILQDSLFNTYWAADIRDQSSYVVGENDSVSVKAERPRTGSTEDRVTVTISDRVYRGTGTVDIAVDQRRLSSDYFSAIVVSENNQDTLEVIGSFCKDKNESAE